MDIFTDSLSALFYLPAPLVVLAILGTLTAATTLYNILGFAAIYTRPSGLPRYLHSSPAGQPPWALVTGASAGIGQQFARELAARGFNVVLHGRNPAKLARVCDELAAAFPARAFRILVADAACVACRSCLDEVAVVAPGRRVDFDAIVSALQGLHLTVLVNNAGGGPVDPTFEPLDDFPERTITGNISLNAVFPTLLTARLLPLLARRAPALVLNVGSLADLGLPYLSFYGSAKLFMMSESVALAREMVLGARDVEVLGVRVGQVTGVFNNTVSPSLFEPGAATMARAALGRVGCGRPTVVGYLPHAVQQVIVDYLPRWLQDYVIMRVLSGKRDVEREAIKRGS